MFMLWLYRIITGYVKFRATGGFTERLLNLCAARGITIWNTRREGEVLYGYVLARQYRKLRPLVRKAGVKMRIAERHGLVFRIRKYRRRKGILAGGLAFFGILWFLSLFVWNINVAGNQTVESAKILKALENVGVHEGVLRSKIDPEVMRQKLLISMPELSWAAINVKGGIAVVDVRETTPIPDFTDSGDPCDIKASCDGRILSVKPYQGTVVCKVGEAVTKGDLLVSGTVELSNGKTLFTHACAEVIAETERKLTVTVPFRQTQTVRAERPQTRRVIRLFWANIPLFLGEVDGSYEVERGVWQPEFCGVRLPVSVTTAKFYQTTKRQVTITEQEARALCRQQMAQKAKQELQVLEYKEADASFVSDQKGVTLIVTYKCKENITKPENILINQ